MSYKLNNGITLHRNHFSSIDSTHLYAKRFLHANLQTNVKSNILSPKLCYLFSTDCQTKGIGQHDRPWFSPKGNIYATYIINPNITQSSIAKHNIKNIPQVAALSVCQALAKFEFVDCKIKWINDIFLDKKKLGGVLCESMITDSLFLIISIGINVNTMAFDASVTKNPTSLKLYMMGMDKFSQDYDIDMILLTLSEVLVGHVLDFFKYGFEKFYSKVNQKLELFCGKYINFVTPSNEKKEKNIVAKVLGINSSGALILKVKNSQEIKCFEHGRILL